MKKSKKLSLVLMGALTLASYGNGALASDVAPAGEPAANKAAPASEPAVFKDKAECVASGKYNEEQCQKMEADAKAQTPKFASREECVKQFGESACKEQGGDSNGSFWMPAIMGFMAGHLLSNGLSAPSQGVYQNPSGNGFQTSAGAPLSPAQSDTLKKPAAPNTAATSAATATANSATNSSTSSGPSSSSPSSAAKSTSGAAAAPAVANSPAATTQPKASTTTPAATNAAPKVRSSPFGRAVNRGGFSAGGRAVGA